MGGCVPSLLLFAELNRQGRRGASMPRARSPTSKKAETLYHKGMSLVDIAEKLDVPPGTVRRWKSTQKWDETPAKTKSERSESKKRTREKKIERSEKDDGNPKRKGGGQPGNVNGCGPHNGGPYGNKNALKHGGYSQTYWDSLEDEEQAFIEDKQDDEEQMLIDQITLYSVRERRIMKAINKYRQLENKKDTGTGQYVASITTFENKRRFADKSEEQEYKDRIAVKVQNGDRLPGDPYNVTTGTASTIDLITRLERELTSVQRSKNSAIDSLIKLRLERQKLQGDTRGNDLVRAWAAAVMKKRGAGDVAE